MRKTDKKIDNQLRDILTDVCDDALKEFTGFQWLTHVVNYANFPNSLKVICVFDTNLNLNSFMSATDRNVLTILIKKKLFEINIDINSNHILFDTEENCTKSNNGKWADRLA